MRSRELLGQAFDEFAEIDAFVGQEEEDDPLAAEKVLHVDQLHRQLLFGDHVPADFVLFLLQFAQLGDANLVFGVHDPDDLPVRGLRQIGHGLAALTGTERRPLPSRVPF